MYRTSMRRLHRELGRVISRHPASYRGALRTYYSHPKHAMLARSFAETLERDADARQMALSVLRRLSTAPERPKNGNDGRSSSGAGAEASAHGKESTSKTPPNDGATAGAGAGASTSKKETSGDGGGASTGFGSKGTSGGHGGPGGRKGFPGNVSPYVWVISAVVAGALIQTLRSQGNSKEISFQEFVWEFLEPGKVDYIEVLNKSTARVHLKKNVAAEDTLPPDYNDPEIEKDGRRSEIGGIKRPGRTSRDDTDMSKSYYFNIGTVETFERKLEVIQEDLEWDPDDFVNVIYKKENVFTSELIKHAPMLLLLGVGIYFLSSGGMGGGIGGSSSNIFRVGKANPIVIKGDQGKSGVTFADVAGLNEAKTEVMEFVDFLKNAQRYEKLGAKIPKGALLVGPPGTGKTLLAKATAGEASVPFFSMSGSDFIEMFVGVGPSRVRDLFAQARGAAPCIVFIDEIDAVGRARGRGGMAGGSDERENTLNALLVEMDGFSTSEGVVVLAGTNRADILDKALLRPGRFDRQINIDKPDMRGRYEIFMVHLRGIKLQGDASAVAKRLAALTPGFAGADIANVCNEAALIAARADKSAVEIVDFENATDRVLGGLEKKNKVISRSEREIVAHHEAGHAVCGWFLEHADPLIKVSIIPRGQAALGFAQYLPMDKVLQSEKQIRDFLIMALGGRVAEALCFGSVTTGAQDDLKRVTKAAYAKVTNFGMSNLVGKVNFPRAGEGASQFYKPYSESTAQEIDDEAIRIIDEAYAASEKLLESKLDIVKELAAKLLEKEVLREDDLIEIMGPRKYNKPVDFDTFVGRFDEDRQRRTGMKDDDNNGSAKDEHHTPPIPTAEGAKKAGSGWREDSETIPELA